MRRRFEPNDLAAFGDVVSKGMSVAVRRSLQLGASRAQSIFSSNEIRRRLHELPRDREVWLYCGVGQRAYYATRVLMQKGFRVKNLAGGFRTYKLVADAEL